MKVAKMQTIGPDPVFSDFLERVGERFTEELYAKPEYHQLVQSVRAKGHRLEYRVIQGEANEGMVMLHLQVLDGGPTVGE